MERIKCKIVCYGAFKEFGESITFDVRCGDSVVQVKEKISKILGSEYAALVQDSVIANQEELLPHPFILSENIELAIFPPVSGG